jgi:hypothetical protein
MSRGAVWASLSARPLSRGAVWASLSACALSRAGRRASAVQARAERVRREQLESVTVVELGRQQDTVAVLEKALVRPPGLPSLPHADGRVRHRASHCAARAFPSRGVLQSPPQAFKTHCQPNF